MAGNWSVAEPRKIVFEEPVGELHVRIVGGTVNVVGVEEGPARLEVTQLEGPALIVTQKGDEVTVAADTGVVSIPYNDINRSNLLEG